MLATLFAIILLCDTVEVPLMTSFNRSQTTLLFSSHSYPQFQAPYLRVYYGHAVWTHNYYHFVFFLFFNFISLFRFLPVPLPTLIYHNIHLHHVLHFIACVRLSRHFLLHDQLLLHRVSS